jgi:hypothetical protein
VAMTSRLPPEIGFACQSRRSLVALAFGDVT